jgi:hypothetical protein
MPCVIINGRFDAFEVAQTCKKEVSPIRVACTPTFFTNAAKRQM